MDELLRKKSTSILNNVVLSASTTDRKQDKLLNRLLQKTVANTSAKVKQTVEYQRKKWTTYRNLNLWFYTWEKDLVELEFAYRDDEYNCYT